MKPLKSICLNSTALKSTAEIGPQQNGIVGILDADPGINLDVAFDIALNEIEVINPRPVIAALHEFAGATKAVIDLFR